MLSTKERDNPLTRAMNIIERQMEAVAKKAGLAPVTHIDVATVDHLQFLEVRKGQPKYFIRSKGGWVRKVGRFEYNVRKQLEKEAK